MMFEHLKYVPRLWVWMVLTIALAGGVAYLSPQQIPVMLYKSSLVTSAAVVAYWIDRSLFKDSAQARMDPNMERDAYSAARLIARALIFVGTVLGLTLGL